MGEVMGTIALSAHEVRQLRRWGRITLRRRQGAGAGAGPWCTVVQVARAPWAQGDTQDGQPTGLTVRVVAQRPRWGRVGWWWPLEVTLLRAAGQEL